MNLSSVKAKFRYEILSYKTGQINNHILFERLLHQTEHVIPKITGIQIQSDPVEFVDNLIEQCEFQKSTERTVQGIALEKIIKTTVNDYFDSEIVEN